MYPMLLTRLHLNAKTTEYMAINVNGQGPLMASNGDPIKEVKGIKYHGLRMESTERERERVTSMRGKHQHGGPTTTRERFGLQKSHRHSNARSL